MWDKIHKEKKHTKYSQLKRNAYRMYGHGAKCLTRAGIFLFQFKINDDFDIRQCDYLFSSSSFPSERPERIVWTPSKFSVLKLNPNEANEKSQEWATNLLEIWLKLKFNWRKSLTLCVVGTQSYAVPVSFSFSTWDSQESFFRFAIR